MASTQPIADAPAAPEVTGTRVLLFRVGALVYGCELEPVREIVPYRKPTRLPGAPAHVQGLINLRGTLVTVIDLGQRLDASRQPVRQGSIVLINHGDEGAERLAGFAVEQVLEVAVLPGTVDDGDANDPIVIGLGQLGEQVVILIDVRSLVTQVLL